MSGIVNKVKEAVSGHHNTSSAPEGTHGTHNSRAANAADPRIDSDRDHRAAPGSTVGGTHGSTVGGTHGYTTGSHYAHGDGAYDTPGTAGTTGTTGLTGATGTTGTTGGLGSHGREGPHKSNVANKLDPRIDSDRSGQRMGNTAGDHYGSGAEGIHGPHTSRVANAADPRVDSDRDASRTVGNTYGSSGTAGTTGAHGTQGTHHGTSQLGGTQGTHHGTSQLGGTHAPGPAPHTAGPHKSDLLNKADPRVDSDLDGSKTVGGNKTYGAHTSASKDPTDASQVPPSVLQGAVGKPTIEHEDAHHGRERRHSLKTAQEIHHGL
ncbi:hypothetical protein F4777DRAFT_144739 [Nemania sp. FL0916]|nr:hypothetical protein F4777DRAFT_144739 [Nemania sp. FL0916]